MPVTQPTRPTGFRCQQQLLNIGWNMDRTLAETKAQQMTTQHQLEAIIQLQRLLKDGGVASAAGCFTLLLQMEKSKVEDGCCIAQAEAQCIVFIAL